MTAPAFKEGDRVKVELEVIYRRESVVPGCHITHAVNSPAYTVELPAYATLTKIAEPLKVGDKVGDRYAELQPGTVLRFTNDDIVIVHRDGKAYSSGSIHGGDVKHTLDYIIAALPL